MIKKSLILTIAAIAVMLSFTSCDKFLERSGPLMFRWGLVVDDAPTTGPGNIYVTIAEPLYSAVSKACQAESGCIPSTDGSCFFREVNNSDVTAIINRIVTTSSNNIPSGYKLPESCENRTFRIEYCYNEDTAWNTVFERTY